MKFLLTTVVIIVLTSCRAEESVQTSKSSKQLVAMFSVDDFGSETRYDSLWFNKNGLVTYRHYVKIMAGRRDINHGGQDVIYKYDENGKNIFEALTTETNGVPYYFSLTQYDLKSNEVSNILFEQENGYKRKYVVPDKSTQTTSIINYPKVDTVINKYWSGSSEGVGTLMTVDTIISMAYNDSTSDTVKISVDCIAKTTKKEKEHFEYSHSAQYGLSEPPYTDDVLLCYYNSSTRALITVSRDKQNRIIGYKCNKTSDRWEIDREFTRDYNEYGDMIKETETLYGSAKHTRICKYIRE